MAIRVLIVDDSSFFRKRLTEIITADSSFEVVGEAKDGKEGVQLTEKLRPDVITMDVEMPVMDGITAVKEIMAKVPTPILMFSSLTFEGANSTFKALEAGAVDFMPKNFDDIAHRRDDAVKQLRDNIKAVARSRVSRKAIPTSSLGSSSRQSSVTSSSVSSASRGTFTSRSTLSASKPTSTLSSSIGSKSVPSSSTSSAISTSTQMAYEKIQTKLSGTRPGTPAAAMAFTFGDHAGETTKFRKSGKSHDLIAIGSSTGGPIALQQVIPHLPKLNVPIVVVQHMPAAFTTTFAQRLNNMSNYTVVEAKDGDLLEPNTCYIAPGGMQMIFEKSGAKARVRILKGDSRVVYHPCVDVSFTSLSEIYGGKVLAMIMTGMGSDGCEGCRILKQKGAVVWAQNEESCVVYGMPQAIVNARIADQVLPLDKFSSCIVEEMR